VVVAAIAAAVPAFAGSAPQASRAASLAVAARSEQRLSAAIVYELNRTRLAFGLSRLKVSAALSRAALRHSDEMATSGRFMHDSPDGTPFWKRVQHFYPLSNYATWNAGETLLWASPDVSARTAVADWLASPPHRKILLDPKWAEVGVAAVHDGRAGGAFRDLECTIVTADFGVRSGRR
jgi:uncharacterized protein YkwD